MKPLRIILSLFLQLSGLGLCRGFLCHQTAPVGPVVELAVKGGVAPEEQGFWIHIGV